MAKSKVNFNWIGHTMADRYKVEALLGQGGMSTVYQAIDPNLQRKVAIKIIHPHLSNDPEFVRRFEQEAAAVAQLRHPNIIQVYDFNHDGNIYYMVLEHIPGETLKDKLKELNAIRQRLPLTDTIQIMATICDAVGYAHERGMIHRDLKPANVMLTPKGEPILMDFGVAKMLGGSDNTATGAVVGTAKYMAPEQARGERPDERSDLYSLGVMLYEMVAGQPPFDADTTIAILMKHVTEPIPDIRRVQSDVPGELASVIEKALAKDRNERYQSAAHMAAALRLIVRLAKAAEPVTDSKATVSSKHRKTPTDPTIPQEAVAETESVPATPLKRPALPLLAGGAVALLLLIGVAAFLLFSWWGGPSSADGSGDSATVVAVAQNLPSSAGMVRIGSGTYSVGLENADRDHAATQQVTLDEFWIDQREISNAQYAEFLAETEGQSPDHWAGGTFPTGEENRPVRGVSWDMAAAYCDWAQKRLPTEAEWEVTARGTEGRLYPWGDNQRAVELPRSGTYDVGTKLTNQSPFGVLDMAGNVWEWVGEPYAPVEEGHRVLRGGSNDFLKDMAYRLSGDPTVPTMVASAGIRCAADEVEVVTTEAVADQNIIYQDSFVDPGSGWPIESEGIVFFGYHPPDYYHVQVGTANSYTAVSRPPLFEDITVETEVRVESIETEAGDYRYGLVLRRTSDQFYAFVVSPRSGAWAVLKSSSTGLETLAEGVVETLRGFAPPGFAPDKNDLLRVDALGPDFVFHINDEVVAKVNDADYAGGEVGFFVQTFDETLAHIHYDSLVIREAELAEAPVLEELLYQDDFTDPESGWPEEDQEGMPYRIGYHPPDYYHVEVRTPEDRKLVTEPQEFEDLTVETNLFVDFTETETGDFRYGLALRRVDDERYYAFTISSRSGSWQIFKNTPAGLELLAEGEVGTLQGFAPPGFSPNKADTLRVDASGSDFIFHINGEPVARISDADYEQGQVGFFVETLDEGLAHIHYDTLTVGPVDQEALTAFEPAPTPEPSTPTSEPLTPTPEPVSDVLPTATPNPSPTIQADVEGMILIPAGSFLMGSEDGEALEQPEHLVSLDAFYIDQFEVSNAQYRECVEAGDCTPSQLSASYTRSDYWDNETYDNYPVINVNWNQAAAYCEWAGKRLPSEAEWEYAASGPENLDWPWGNSFDADLSAASASDTEPVDSYPEGVSPFGVYNMAGNVIEWVQDVFDEEFYASSEESSNPVSTGEGTSRILRGGSFDNTEANLYRTSRRLIKSSTFYDVDTGFRCAQDAR